MIDLIVTTAEESIRFNTISYRPQIESAIGLFKGYQAFDTRKEALKGVMEAFRDPNVRMVAIYGMGGIGKTMLAKEAMRQAKEEKLFSEMVITSVSQTPNIKQLQQEIADYLGLRFDQEESTARRADRLRNRLKQEKKFLLVLDDIWNKLDLLDIGIHFEDDQRGCKILLTSRIRDAICKDIDVEKSFNLDPLLSDEAKGLFRKIVGNVMEHPNFLDLASQLVKECGGLPIAIVTVASALKNKTKFIWENALVQLRSSRPENIDGMPKEVYSSIRLSYDYLKSEEAESLLLLCGLHREDENIEINDMVKYCVGWDLFEDIVTLEETRNRMNSLVDTLKSRCLLLDGDSHETVKMHDIIRDVSIWIAAKEKHIYSLSDVANLDKLLNKGKLNDSKAISILDTDFVKLPQKLEFSHIELILMHCNNQQDSAMRTIPEHFFEETKRLKVLVLKSSEITLPFSSFRFPLCLRNSKLEDVGLIGDLKNLKILDLSYTNIRHLPLKIGQLSCLQLLDLQGCPDLKVIEPNVLSSLVRLEELYMAETFDKWEVKGVNTKRRNASFIELKNLRELTTLYLCVPDIEIFQNEYLFGDKLQRYQIYIKGYKYYKEYSRSLGFRDWFSKSQIIASGFQKLMRRLEQMSLNGLSKVKDNLFYDLDKEGFPELKSLELSVCNEIQYVVNAMEDKSAIHTCRTIFLKLESLHLSSLENLEEICHGTLTADSFSQLRKINVKNCGKLMNLFPFSIATRLHQIEVEECDIMEEIVGHDHKEDEVAFDELHYLSLFSLPKLVQFINSRPQLGVTSTSFSAQSSNYPLFSDKVMLPKLERMRLCKINVKKLWADTLPSTFNCIQNLSDFDVSQCNNLEYISSLDLAKSLVKLQTLKVRDCQSLEVMFILTKKQGEDEEGTSLLDKHSLPQLQALHLYALPSIKTLCGTIDKEKMQLDEQQPLFNGTVALSGLKYLDLCGLNIETLWHDFDRKPLAATSYMENLTNLEVSYCNKLKYLFTFAMVERIVNLRRLYVSKCTEIEDIFVVRKKLAREDLPRSEQILFPKLETIELDELQSLKSFCAGADDCIQLPTLSTLDIRGTVRN